MKKAIHVKSYIRKKHGRAKFGGKVSSHNKSGRISPDEIRALTGEDDKKVIRGLIKQYFKTRGAYLDWKDLSTDEKNDINATLHKYDIPLVQLLVARDHLSRKQYSSGRYVRGVPKDSQLFNQLRAMVGSKVLVKGDFPVNYKLKDVGVTPTGDIEAIIEDQYGTDVVPGKLIMKARSGRAKMKIQTQYLAVPRDEMYESMEYLRRKGVTSETYIGLDGETYLKFKDKATAEKGKTMLRKWFDE